MKVRCMYCGGKPQDKDGFFIVEGTDTMYHEECPDIYRRMAELKKEAQIQIAIIDKTIEWVGNNHHYGDIPEMTDKDKLNIISEAFGVVNKGAN